MYALTRPACTETIDIEFSHALGYRFCIACRSGWWEQKGTKIPRPEAYALLGEMWHSLPA